MAVFVCAMLDLEHRVVSERLPELYRLIFQAASLTTCDGQPAQADVQALPGLRPDVRSAGAPLIGEWEVERDCGWSVSPGFIPDERTGDGTGTPITYE